MNLFIKSTHPFSLILCTVLLLFLFGACEQNPCAEVVCGSNATCVEGTCACTGDYVRNAAGECACPAGMVADANGDCICGPGMITTANGDCIADPCLDANCGNGTCDNGNCLCDAGYEQDANGNCTVVSRTKFLGTYQISETCNNAGRPNHAASLTAGNGIQGVTIYNLHNANNVLAATVEGNTITIASQSYGSATVSGSGTLDGRQLTLQYTYTDASGNAQNCTATMNK